MKHLLFVDDEARVLDGLRRLLRSRRDQWECHFATSVDEALAISNEIELDTVVTDVNMPGKSGLDLLQILRSQPSTQTLPVLILTGNGDVSVKRRALALGATDFLSKPFDFEDLIARLQNVLALKGFQDEIRNQNAILEQRVIERTAQLEASQREIILRLAKAAETRDSDTGSHILRVGIGAQMLAAALGYDPDMQQALLLTAPLHDVGKIGILDQVLQKMGPLTIEERLKMEQHCQIGATILTESLGPLFDQLARRHTNSGSLETSPNNLLRLAASIALRHHERWDGKGYPDGLAGVAIPIEARIVAVADVYDALRSARPYKEAYDQAKSMVIIEAGSGTQFDPAIVACFLECVDEMEAALAPFRDDLALPIAA